MTQRDGLSTPRLRRADLRRLRDSMLRGETSLPIMIAAPGAVPHPTESTGVAETAGTILTVCTGNICRSPMAEALLRSELASTGVRVHSAGTHALVDEGMPEQALELAVANGADAGVAHAHRARLLAPPLLAESDLVLAVSREHRSAVVQMSPALLRRTFTVREFARLAATLSDDDVSDGLAASGADAGARLQALARLVGSRRGLVPADPGNDDVVDPYRRSQTTYDLSASQLVPAVTEASRVIRAALAVA